MEKTSDVLERREIAQKQFGFRRKRVLFIVFLLALLNKANAQIDYDIEINGLRYTVDVEALNATLVDVNPSVSNVIVPSDIVLGSRTFEVDKVVLRFGYYDYHFIRSIHLSNKVVELDFGLWPNTGYSQYYSFEPFPEISNITIPNSVKTLSIGCIKELKVLRIPQSVEVVKKLNNIPDLETLIIEDGPNDLSWGISSPTIGVNITDGFYGMRKVDYVYIGRQLRGAYCFGYGVNGTGSHVNPQTVIIGPYVKDLTHYNLYVKNIRIPNTVEKGMVCTYSLTDSLAFEDGQRPYDSVVHCVEGKVIYIGRPYAWIEKLETNKVTIGPTLTSKQAADFFNNAIFASVTEEILLYQAEPPQLTKTFTNATYVNAHLYVPLGYKTLYENAPIWKNFVFIEEFDYEVPENTVVVINNNPEGGSVSGGGTYHYGETVTLTAISNEGYYFQEWTENGVVISRDSEYTFGLNGDRVITANFSVSSNNEYLISATSNNSGWGTVSGAGVYNLGETVTLTAIPFGTNTFDNWTENGIWVSSNKDYSFVVNGNRNLVANFRYKGTGIEEESATEISVIVRDRMLSIIGAEENKEIKVFNGLGQIIYQGFNQNIRVYRAGVYIVIVENKKIKVIVG